MLEPRALLSTLTVTNDADSGQGSLRYELGQAQNGDTIVFSPKAYGTITLSSGPLEVATGVNIKGPGRRQAHRQRQRQLDRLRHWQRGDGLDLGADDH